MSEYNVVLSEGTILRLNKESVVILAGSEDFLAPDTHIRLVNEDGELVGKGYVEDCVILPFNELKDTDFAAVSHPLYKSAEVAQALLYVEDRSFSATDDVMYLRFTTDYIETASVYVDYDAEDLEEAA